MKESPLVSVICLCHNQADYVAEAIDSVIKQTYPNVELIVVDDGSRDGSQNVIRQQLANTSIEFISIPKSIGNCKAFNSGFRKSKGQFVIDLAADDSLLPTRIEMGINTFKSKSDIGVEFCNVLNVEADGTEKSKHFQTQDVPDGDLYELLIQKYYISPPGMMIKREVLDQLNGYNEELNYEDYDFWIRSSRNYRYGYTNDVLVKKRILSNSLSTEQFRFRNKYQRSTLQVCKMIKNLNASKNENLALRKRSLYEIKQCLINGNLELIPGFLRLI